MRLQTASTAQPAVPSVDSNRHLMQALNVTPDDLALNRQGKMSERQRQQFNQWLGKGQRSGVLAIFAVLLLTGFIVVRQFLTDGELADSLTTAFEQAPVALIAGVGGSLLLFVLIGLVSMLRMGSLKNRPLKVDSVSGKVKLSSLKAEGEAATVARMAGMSRVTYVLQIGRMKIYTQDATAYSAFENGASYRVYYVKVSSMPMLVSAELA